MIPSVEQLVRGDHARERFTERERFSARLGAVAICGFDAEVPLEAGQDR